MVAGHVWVDLKLKSRTSQVRWRSGAVFLQETCSLNMLYFLLWTSKCLATQYDYNQRCPKRQLEEKSSEHFPIDQE